MHNTFVSEFTLKSQFIYFFLDFIWKGGPHKPQMFDLLKAHVNVSTQPTYDFS